MKKSFSFPIIFMILLTAFFTFILAVLNYQTIDVVAFNQETEFRRVLLNVFDLEVSEDPEEIASVFNEYIEEEGQDAGIYIYKEGNEIKGYAFPAGGAGLWGTIEAYVGISEDYSTILGFDFIEQNETPGLGGRITEDWFKEQFRDLDVSNTESGDLFVFRPAVNGNVDAIAGATLTSQSVSNFLNIHVSEFIQERKGDN